MASLCFVALLLLQAGITIATTTYPPYCSKPDALATRTIPPLSSATTTLYPSLELLNVNTVIRHGARTPYTNYDCWSDYLATPENSVYNCDDPTMLMTPTSSNENVLFRKVYDALSPPLTNLLGGTCHVGQLLPEGVTQERTNGAHLRSAYITSSDSLRLFKSLPSPPTNYASLPYPQCLHAQGDDQQRTLMSGQLLITGLFDVDQGGVTSIDYHTADYKADPIYPNSNVCPKLSYLYDLAVKSEEFIATNSSSLDGVVDGVGGNWDHVLDCLYGR